jgi:ribonuclease D
MQAAVQKILVANEQNDTLVLGFDTETRPTFQKGDWNPTALIQLATADCVYLFRICRLRNHSFTPLIPIFESETILKCGVDIANDVRELLKVQTFRPRGFMEITDMTKRLNYKLGGLQGLTALILKRRLSKKAKMTNWDKHILEPKEINYAALDAWIGRELYLKVRQEEMEQSLTPVESIDLEKLEARKLDNARLRRQRHRQRMAAAEKALA